MCVFLAVLPRCDAGEPPEGAGKMRRVAVTQPICDMGHFRAGCLQHVAGDVETRLIQHFLSRIMRHIDGLYTQRYNRLKKPMDPCFEDGTKRY